MDVTVMEKSEVIKNFAIHPTDVGSPEVRIAILTKRIKNLARHLQKSKKDVHSRKGLIDMINKRRKLLKYLNKKDNNRYMMLIEKLELRK
ncbi:MAG: 30S ribosomal protein S15 [Candidatus Dadabacteria bacterium]|nr:30S ribosomal protein S15 [Candidatus Dadabacteria bacterium]NIT13115.1 30S ribosomal protein S15 [Candidatus Dadabacteria bacterium]